MRRRSARSEILVQSSCGFALGLKALLLLLLWLDELREERCMIAVQEAGIARARSRRVR